MDTQNLIRIIDTAWENRSSINSSTSGETRDAIEYVVNGLDSGQYRVCEKSGDDWVVNQWLKKAVLMSFRLNDSTVISSGLKYADMGDAPWFDKVPSKFSGWSQEKYAEAGFRAVPNCVVRRGSYVASNVVLMPSFTNIGAYVDSGTMIDSYVTVGSCAQIGKNCHISAGVVIGGVLEPLQANPVIIEDNVFVGGQSEVSEGVIVREGAVLAIGVYLSQSTKIVNRATGEVTYGEIPPYSVVVPGALPGKPLADGTPGPSLYCNVIVKTVDDKTRSKTSINDLLRD
ncbi:2,3,4,5-tetrahydropyridine-2,6-dicarboxylate N-succinyltransferase [Leptolyngbyaceae cyanobacterium CCMR0082]|uniref:2,3,4,5-tetrahydropyridine-2,6-dicarboxylate N-succinyltransferase n=2 Tax=Adonisia turfae TaxID=2950184 RepID=A0A6M0S1Y2_9CYAN|nr:2,3,4,5-tetrahydropyridine-2,6-dicarboxylate N-succinyltransferase [Adonisia turfae]EKV00634.1 2,3,4,5-tetrahydropyridine-2,6-dicarboxylate N-succinyltransferase [Leptolyngbya sp. PCC 7375]NEZ59438.1 2,3,4,5-tetrahydropyridine-2,6-dicarboxylate N-succinyltransferase [Adonisia turfae CCMR0081]NEZ62448.1 2,3,4,5-tetrahydropyridine-2,6-dicarboxylate N-succinyltransferase [Adonisia turfae CCMR0082]